MSHAKEQQKETVNLSRRKKGYPYLIRSGKKPTGASAKFLSVLMFLSTKKKLAKLLMKLLEDNQAVFIFFLIKEAEFLSVGICFYKLLDYVQTWCKNSNANMSISKEYRKNKRTSSRNMICIKQIKNKQEMKCEKIKIWLNLEK